jgi:cysteine desulfurase
MTQRPRIYLDHAATTPILPAAKAAMVEAMERWANPSSPHAEGRAARAALEDARERIKKALGWSGELIFTSGATEAIEIAMRCAKLKRRLLTPVEHDCVYRAAPDGELLTLDRNGEVDRDDLSRRLQSAGPALVAIQHVNSETGQIQPVDELAAAVRNVGGLTLCDAAQSSGKRPLPNADIVVVSAHKLGGPPGIGALLVRDLSTLQAGGGQERGYRGGTENVPGAVGFATALENQPDAAFVTSLNFAQDDLVEAIFDQGGRQIMSGYGRERSAAYSWHILALSMPRLPAATQLIKFDLAGFAVSAGSACSSGSMKPSRALTAFGIDPDEVGRTIRISFGWNTDADHIAAFGEAWLRIASEARSRAA